MTDHEIVRSEARRYGDAFPNSSGKLIAIIDSLIDSHQRIAKLANGLDFFDYAALARNSKSIDNVFADAQPLLQHLEKVPAFMQLRSTSKILVEAETLSMEPLNEPLNKLSLGDRRHLFGASHFDKVASQFTSAEILYLAAAKRQKIAGELIVSWGERKNGFDNTKLVLSIIDDQLKRASKAYRHAREVVSLTRNPLLMLKSRAGETICDVMRLRLLPFVSREEVVEIARKPRFFERDNKRIDAQLIVRFSVVATLTGSLHESQYEEWRRSKNDFETRHKVVARIVDGLLQDWADDEATVWSRVPDHPWDPETKRILEILVVQKMKLTKDAIKNEGPVASSSLLRHLAIAQFKRWDERERERLVP